MTQAISSAREMYLRYPKVVLQDVTAKMGLQIRNLLLTTHSLASTIKSSNMCAKPDIDNMEKYLAEDLDTEAPKKIDTIQYEPLDVLNALCEIDAEITSLVEDYAEDIYKRACHRDNPYAIPPPLQLSSVERHRLTRAFYRLKLFGVLFYNYADRFHVNLERSYTAFFARLGRFEIDELVTAYQFALRERRYFKSLYVHERCMYFRSKPWMNNDPFNCKTCRGMYIMHNDEAYAEPRAEYRRSAQPFWYTAYHRFLDFDGLWAKSDFDVCRMSPIIEWCDISEANRPGAGWTRWDDFYCSSNRVSRQVYVNVFRILGYCFWDNTRLAQWGNMFTHAWALEESHYI